MDDRARVAELLGRTPRGDFEVVVRDDTGDPVVVRNAPFLDDGTPMPTRYYLVGNEIVKAVSRIEASGGVDRVESELDPDDVAAIHRRYAIERDCAIDAAHSGPRPSGGVGGTRVGVKCLHAHVAHQLATGDDAIGRWTIDRIPPGTPGLSGDRDPGDTDADTVLGDTDLGDTAPDPIPNDDHGTLPTGTDDDDFQ